MKPIFSIIVPVYNVEKYIHRCIDSLIYQTFTDIEIIIVDDGSIDDCPLICDEYAKLDNRIKVIHKTNGGLSDARNCGIKAAIGEYILFVDSDDYLDENSCESFLKYTKENIDIILGNAREIKEGAISYINHSQLDNLYKFTTGVEVLKHELERDTMHMAACMNLYRREFLIDNNLFFKYGIFHEDEQWTPRVFLAAKKCAISDITFYNYIIRENSITRKKDKIKNAIDLMDTIYDLANVYNSIDDFKLKDLLNNYLVTLYLNAFYIGRLYRKEFKNCIDKSFLLDRATSRRNIIKVKIFCLNINVYYYINKFTKVCLRMV